MSARSLESIQADMLAALEGGPGAIFYPDFAAVPERIVLGMKVHANTTSHARLVALEESFPRLRAELGESRFHALSRAYLSYNGVKSRSLDLIGSDFPAWLDGAEGNAGAAAIARFEWLWLEAFHSAEAPALHLVDLAGLAEDDLLGLVVSWHPAARPIPLVPALHLHLQSDVPGLDDASAILIVRPEADVRIVPLSLAAERVASCLQGPAAIGNLLDAWTEQYGEAPEEAAAFMAALIGLIECGAIVRGG